MLTYPKPLYYLKPFDTEVLERVAAISWLSEAGRPFSGSGARQITYKQEAVSLITAPKWDDFRLEMRNETTGFLAKRWSKNYTEWNDSASGVAKRTWQNGAQGTPRACPCPSSVTPYPIANM